jgi:hypothetical protein
MERGGRAFVLTLGMLVLGAGCVSNRTAETRVQVAKRLETGAATLEIAPLGLGALSRKNPVRFYVAEIDGPKGRQNWALESEYGFYPLEAGVNSITVKAYGYDYTDPNAEASASVATLVLVAASGVAYTITSFEGEDTLTLAIAERDTQKRVTLEVEMPITRPPPPAPTAIPIIIPIIIR